MTQCDARPSVGVAHVVLQTDAMQKSADFMEVIGMRPIFRGESVSVFEMRGGTHLILMKAESVAGGSAPFDLMVDDIREAHQRFTEIGLMPSSIEPRLEIDHEIFTVREPSGYIITFFSNHGSGQPV